MGLDQYVYCVKRCNVIDDFSFKQGRLLSDGVIDEFGNNLEFDYWRKFIPLDRWAYKVYLKKGGKGEFDCAEIKLNKEDLDELYALSQTDEFYQNGYYGDAKKERAFEYHHLVEFIKNATAVIFEGDAIYYHNWR